MRKSYKPTIKKKSFQPQVNIEPINESLYINTIISNNIVKELKFHNLNFKKLIPTSNINLLHLIRKMNYICFTKSNYKQLKNDTYLNIFIYFTLYIIEYKSNTKLITDLLVNNYIYLLNKIYINKKISIRDISILIKFITYCSIYQRKEINKQNINLLSNLSKNRIKYYEIIKFVIDILKKLNIDIVTIEFCEFLNAHFFPEKYNLYLLTEKIDLLELLFLNDKNDFVLDFLSKVYSFRSNKAFLGLFFEKIKNIYKERRDKNITKENEKEMNSSFLKLLNNINRSILFIQSIKQNEENKSKEDTYFPEKGFIFNNNKTNGLYIEKIIVNNSLTIVFSFCFSPEQSNANTNKNNDIEYPIIFACSDKDPKDYIYFYIKGGFLYYKQFKANKNYNICNIKNNQTYLCYFSIKEHNILDLTIKSDNFEFEVCDVYNDFLKKNMTMRIGRYDRQNFEGYIGPILIFKELFENEYKNYIFSLKGYYDKILYFHEYNTNQNDKYDKYINHILNDDNCTNCMEIKEENKKIIDKNIKKEKEKDKKNKNKKKNKNNDINIPINPEIKITNREYYLEMKKKLKENDILNKNLMCYISPLFNNSSLKRSYFVNSIFTETLIKKFINDSKNEKSSTIFYKNKCFIFQFLKYDGINYLIMALELIITNSNIIKTDLHKKVIIDIFQCILIFMNGLLSYICIENYLDSLCKFLFCIKKFFVKFSKEDTIGNEIHFILNNTLQNFESLNENNYTENKKYCINAIKNEICKILLNAELYDLNNFSLINKFMKNLDIFIGSQKNSSGLLSINLFKKIIDFAIIYDKINIKNSDIKHDLEFKSFRNYFSKIIINFVNKSESLDIYTELYNIFSNDLKFNYLKYQSIKLFYLVSENYFNTVDENTLIKSWKYFIDLYEYFEKNENNHNSETSVNEKEEHIIMSICIRIFLENLKYKEFFKLKLNKYDSTEPLENLLLKTKEEDIKNNINRSIIYKLMSSGYWTESTKIEYKDKDKEKDKEKDNKTNIININDKRKRKHIRFKSFTKEENDTIFNLDFEHIYKKKRINTYWGKKMKKENNNFHSTNNLLSYSITLNNTNINDNIKKKNKYAEYYSYHALFTKLSKSGKLNDYCFKSMILFILENNNKVIIPNNIRLNFILKVKKYEQLQNQEFKNFLCIKKYTKEIREEFRLFIKILELNKSRLSNICYDILLYIIIQIIKDKELPRNITSLFVESHKITNKLYKFALLHNKQSANLFIEELPLFIKFSLPYHRKIFIAYLLYESIFDNYIHNNYAEKLFNIFLNTKIELDNNNIKVYYDFILNKIIALYHIFKADKTYLDDKIELDEKGLLSLVDENLMYIKYDILYSNKKKCYVELLFDFFINLYIKSNNLKYKKIFNKIFIDDTEKIKKKVKGAKTLFFYIDKNTIKDDKKNPCYKYYNKNKIETSLCIDFLMKILIAWINYRNKNNDIQIFLQNLINYLFEDSKLIYKENKIFQKKDKNNVWYNFLLDNLHEIVNNKKNIKIEDIQKKLVEKSEEEAKNKEEKNLNKSSMLNITYGSNFNLSITNNSDLDFGNGNNSISENENDESNIEINRNSINKIKEDKNKKINNIDEGHKNNNINNINNINNNIIIDATEKFNKIRKKILENKNQYTIIRRSNLNNNKYKYIDEILDIENINFDKKVILFPRKDFIEQRFSIYFSDILFYNKLFILLKNYFKIYIKNIQNICIDINNFFNFPTIIRNFTPQNTFFGGFFLKNDLNFFDNKLIKISHPYFIEKMQKYKIKNIEIFPKKTIQDDIHNLLIEKQINDSNIFYVDLVTNRNVVFGQLIVCKNLIYFENLSKEEFLKNKTDSAKEKWLLCSLDCDYSSRVKKIYIFKNEIREIINRRFLYLFQACELFLKNGKSYYFNFYSEEKKIKFFSIFTSENKLYNIDLIYDIKSFFKKKNYTKQWLTNELSNLEYLLFLNKFSSRSYNDINQYPVFPWLEIYGGQTRDLKYTIAAQTEDERMIKREMYLASSEKFPYHYTTHFSNSAYLAYYLVRTNPFTNNQINLQVNKFDNPMRQFNAIDEILKILKQTSQPREVIPEFYLSTEFYYNYNCNFFGITDDNHLINNLYNKEGFQTPLEYILHNLLLLETPSVKNEINYFFDMIYGVGQMGGVDAYNTYNKYSYQEMFDLREKIAKYKQQELNYHTIKEKIISKCNKIISFGQTPFKLLEDKHPQWTQKKEVNENITNNNTNLNLTTVNTNMERTSLNLRTSNTFYFDDENNNISGIKISANILFFEIFSYPHKDSVKQCIIMLNKFTKYKYELKFYKLKFKELSSIKTLSIPKEIKLFSKLKIFNSKFLHAYKYNPKYIMIHFKLSLFILCHFNDNSFKIFTPKGDIVSVMTESMVTCISKINENSFMTGHFNGRIIIWELPNIPNEKELGLNDCNNIHFKNGFIAHKKRVNIMLYNNKLDVIISSGDDKKIFIRKIYDLTLLSMIDISNYICIDIKVEHYYLYVLLFDEIKQKHIVKIFSLNGIEVGKSDYDYINNINFDKDGNLLIGYYKKDYIDIYDPSLNNKIGEIHLILNEQSKILGNDKKNVIKSDENISIGNDILFMNFSYNKNNNSVYCTLSNGFLFCKNLNNN